MDRARFLFPDSEKVACIPQQCCLEPGEPRRGAAGGLWFGNAALALRWMWPAQSHPTSVIQLHTRLKAGVLHRKHRALILPSVTAYFSMHPKCNPMEKRSTKQHINNCKLHWKRRVRSTGAVFLSPPIQPPRRWALRDVVPSLSLPHPSCLV